MNYYAEFASIRNQKAQLEAQEEILKEKIMADISSKGETFVNNEHGRFTVATKRTWIYSKKVDKAAEDLKLMKISEEKSGKATCKENPYLTFKAPKTDADTN